MQPVMQGQDADVRVARGWCTLVASALGASVAGLAPPSAWADELRVTPEILTDVPLGLGAGVEAEFRQIRFGVTALWDPPAYVQLADEVGQAVGGYDDLTSALVRAATENALALRFRAGVRPFASAELYVDVNYTLLALGGSFTTDDLAAASGQTGSAGQTQGWDLTSTVHQVGLEIGYRFLFDALSVRVALGGSFTVAADVDVQAVNPRFPALQAVVEEAGATYLEDTYTSYVHLPVVSVAIGWDFRP